MELDQIIERQKNLSWTKMGERIVVLDSRDGRKYHEMEDVAAYIWELTEKSPSIAQIIEQVASQFDISQEEARTDVIEFIEVLKNQNLIS